MTTPTAPTSFIDQLLQSRQERIDNERQVKTEARKANKDLLTQSLMEALGDFWPIVNQYGVDVWEFDGSNLPIVRIEIPALDDLQLAPMSIGAYGKKFSADYYKPPFFSFGSSFHNLVDALAHARQHYADYKERAKENAIKDAKADLWIHNGDELKAIEAHRLLIEIAPDNKTEWDGLLDNWNAYRERMRKQNEEQRAKALVREENQRKYQQHYTEHIQILVGWLKNKNLILSGNEMLAESIRERFSQPYHEYKLTYGIVAQDEEGDHYVDTNHVYVLDPVPNSDGYWMVNGQPKKFYHLVSIEQFTTKPVDGYLARRVVRGGVTIHFSPLMSEDTIERAVSHLIELPKQPEYTGGILNQYESSTECLRQARGIINTEGESDNDQAS